MQKNLAKILLVSFGALASNYVAAIGSKQEQNTERRSAASTQPGVTVQGDFPLLPADVTDLKFNEFFKLPIGPRGLDATEKLLSLAGKRVRIAGYMVRQETPSPGFFILAPYPVALGDEDEQLADDLPASMVFVHVDRPAQSGLHSPGLLQLTGTLSLGSFEKSDGHVSTVRLQLDADSLQAMMPAQEGSEATVLTMLQGQRASK